MLHENVFGTDRFFTQTSQAPAEFGVFPVHEERFIKNTRARYQILLEQ